MDCQHGSRFRTIEPKAKEDEEWMGFEERR